MEKHTVSDVGQKGITRLVSRFQRDFSLEQTPDSLILQAEKVRDLTLSLLSVASQSPDRLGVFLSVISGMGDIGVIYDMDTAVSETRRLMSLLPVERVKLSSPPQIEEPATIEVPATKAKEAVSAPPQGMDMHLFDDGDDISRKPFPDAEMEHVEEQPHIKQEAASDDADRHLYGETFVHGMSTTLPEKPGQWISPKNSPQVDIGHSLSEDSITCLHCGEDFTMIKRHIERQHRQTPEDYRAYWGLPPDYPMAAINYTQLKREEAKGTGLGTYARAKRSRKKENAR